jgi:hypothetical protein
MLLKVVFDKTAFVKLEISNNCKQNIDETHSKPPKGKSIPAHEFKKTHERNPQAKSLKTFAKCL